MTMLALSLVVAAMAERTSYALVVGNNVSSDSTVAPLRYADDDAARFDELFALSTTDRRLLTVLDAPSQRLYPGLASTARAPTRAELLRAFEELNGAMSADAKAGREPTFFFVFTGHGRRNGAGEGSIELADADFTRSELFDLVLKPAKARWVHVIVDACDSYFFVHARGTTLPVAPAATAALERHLEERSLAALPHIGAVVSTSSEQESHEWQAIGAGIFSHQVRSALAGAADVNRDGRVEYSELAAFVAAANAQVVDPRQRLTISVTPPSLDRAAPLSEARRQIRAAFLLVPRRTKGHHSVEDERGVRVAEFNKEVGATVLLCLSPGRDHWVRVGDTEARFHAAPGAVHDLSSLTFASVPLASRGATDATLRQNLFAEPFGPRFYRGFVASSGEVPAASPVAVPR